MDSDVTAINILDEWLKNLCECGELPTATVYENSVSLDWGIETEKYHHQNEMEYNLKLGKVLKNRNNNHISETLYCYNSL